MLVWINVEFTFAFRKKEFIQNWLQTNVFNLQDFLIKLSAKAHPLQSNSLLHSPKYIVYAKISKIPPVQRRIILFPTKCFSLAALWYLAYTCFCFCCCRVIYDRIISRSASSKCRVEFFFTRKKIKRKKEKTVTPEKGMPLFSLLSFGVLSGRQKSQFSLEGKSKKETVGLIRSSILRAGKSKSTRRDMWNAPGKFLWPPVLIKFYSCWGSQIYLLAHKSTRATGALFLMALTKDMPKSCGIQQV